MDNKTPIIYRRGKSNKVNDVNINNGQILITTDKGEMFVDTPDNKRIKITDNSKADIEYVDQKLANFDPQHTIAEKEYNPESEYAQSGIAVAEAVSNCSNAIRNTAQGKIVIINDLSPIDNKLNIELENPENNIYIFGKNLCPINSLRIVESAIVEEQKDSLSGLIILDNIKTHGRYTLSANIIRNEADIVTDPFMRIKINYNNGEASISTTNILENGKYSTSIETNETLNIQNIELYLCKYTTASSRDIDITNIQFEANGIPTDFEEYKPVQQNRITDIIKGYSPYTTIMANNSNIICEYNQDLNKTAFVGKSTIYGGEIFNDYENNQALSAYSSANGSENTAGIRGFEVKEIDKTNNLLYLDSVIGLTEGDKYYSIANYDTTNEITELGTIQEINRFDNFIKVSILPKYKGYIIIPDKPLIGTISLGENSSVFGQDNKAYGFSSYAQGAGNIAFNHYAHSEGRDTKAYGHTSHTEGNSTIAVGVCAHAEGRTSQAIGEASHAENGAQAKGYYSHAEGVGFTGLLPEGDSSTQNGSYSHAEGQGKAYGQRSHAENSGSAKGVDSHAENNATASGPSSHAEGMGEASGSASHAENNGYATGDFSHAEGLTEARGEYSHSEGYGNEAFGKYSHVEGTGNQVTAEAAHAEGTKTRAYKNYSHTEGYGTVTGNESEPIASTKDPYSVNSCQHAEGDGTLASKHAAHAEGWKSIASGVVSHAENNGKATGAYSHAEGSSTASGFASHAEGSGCKASSTNAHAEGYQTEANHNYSHAGGFSTKTGREIQTVIGKNNKITNDALFVVGNGTSDLRTNAFEIKDDGSGTIQTQGVNRNSLIRSDFFMDYLFDKNSVTVELYNDGEKPFRNVWIDQPAYNYEITGKIYCNTKIYDVQADSLRGKDISITNYFDYSMEFKYVTISFSSNTTDLYVKTIHSDWDPMSGSYVENATIHELTYDSQKKRYYTKIYYSPYKIESISIDHSASSIFTITNLMINTEDNITVRQLTNKEIFNGLTINENVQSQTGVVDDWGNISGIYGPDPRSVTNGVSISIHGKYVEKCYISLNYYGQIDKITQLQNAIISLGGNT